MSFRAFGIPIHVQFGFWLTCLFLGFDILQGPYKFNILVWAVVVFVSIMVHELGHAFAMIRYGLQPEITLYMLGGMTSAQGMNRLTRPQRIFVSFAGPLAGFILGGLVWGLLQAVDLHAPAQPTNVQIALDFGVTMLLYVNIAWGLFNLVPVLPLDGGHILEDLLGPKRLRATTIISMTVAGAIVLWAVSARWWIVAIIMGLAAAQSYQRYRMTTTATSQARPSPVPPPEEAIAPELQAKLREAKAALADERYEEAGTMAELILSEKPPKTARIEALHILGWAHLREDRPAETERVLKAIARDGEPDLALLGALLFDKDEQANAREVYETARATGDDRKEIVGPLIQILISQGEVARASAVALDVVETLSEEDARQMAAIAYDNEAYQWSARLREAVFERTQNPSDAYEAARAMSLHGDATRALDLLRRAVAAGYSDATRVWSDKALEKLRSVEESELESILPKPAS